MKITLTENNKTKNNGPEEISRLVYDKLTAIQSGKANDEFSRMYTVK